MTNEPIEETFPPAWPDSPLPYKLLCAAYNELRERAIRLEAASLRVAGLADLKSIGPVMLAKIVEEAQAALKP